MGVAYIVFQEKPDNLFSYLSILVQKLIGRKGRIFPHCWMYLSTHHDGEKLIANELPNGYISLELCIDGLSIELVQTTPNEIYQIYKGDTLTRLEVGRTAMDRMVLVQNLNEYMDGRLVYSPLTSLESLLFRGAKKHYGWNCSNIVSFILFNKMIDTPTDLFRYVNEVYPYERRL